MLFVVTTANRSVIVQARDTQDAVQTASSFVGGPATARPATYQDTQTIPLLGAVLQGDNRPAAQADPQFVASFGLGPTVRGDQPTGSQVLPQDELQSFLTQFGNQSTSGQPTGQVLSGGTGIGGQQAGTFPINEEVSGAFRRGLSRLGLGPERSFIGRDIFEDQSGAVTNALLARSAAGLIPQQQGVPESRALEEALVNTPFLSNLGSQAKEAFNILQGYAASGVIPEQAEMFAAPTTFQNQRRAAELARTAARARLGGFFAQNLLPSAEELTERYRSQPAELQPSFLTYLRGLVG